MVTLKLNVFNDEKAYYAFKIYDMDNDGYISMSDLYDTLRKVFSTKQSEVPIRNVYEARANRNIYKTI